MLVSLLSCATKPPDEPVCIELSMERGWCTNTISAKEFFVDEENPHDFGNGPETWWQVRPKMLLMPASTYVGFKKFIIKICKNNNNCEEFSNWERTVEQIDHQLSGQ